MGIDATAEWLASARKAKLITRLRKRGKCIPMMPRLFSTADHMIKLEESR